MKLKMTLPALVLLAMGFSSAAAYADSVTFTLQNPDAYAPNTGGTDTFVGTISAPSSNSAAVYLNGDSFNVTAPVTLNDADFFSSPSFLAPGASFTGDLFTLTLPSGAPFETFLGTFTLLGGPDGNTYSDLGTVNFALTTTPEPSSVVLLLTGFAALAWAGYRRNLYGWAR